MRAMSGMDRQSGRWIEGNAHLQQSIRNILSTRIGTRVERRDYGSGLSDLVDENADRRFDIEIRMAAAQAIRRWEPRVIVERVQRASTAEGAVVFVLDVRTRSGQRSQMMVPTDDAAEVISPERLEALIDGEYRLQRIIEQDRAASLESLE